MPNAEINGFLGALAARVEASIITSRIIQLIRLINMFPFFESKNY